jgi:hypothetical protein
MKFRYQLWTHVLDKLETDLSVIIHKTRIQWQPKGVYIEQNYFMVTVNKTLIQWKESEDTIL